MKTTTFKWEWFIKLYIPLLVHFILALIIEFFDRTILLTKPATSYLALTFSIKTNINGLFNLASMIALNS